MRPGSTLAPPSSASDLPFWLACIVLASVATGIVTLLMGRLKRFFDTRNTTKQRLEHLQRRYQHLETVLDESKAGERRAKRYVGILLQFIDAQGLKAPLAPEDWENEGRGPPPERLSL
jgi:hypothetical protein